jgi:dTDP-4-amino-4,6-dideoxygalactose transaminase
MRNPFEIVKWFEEAIAEYTGAPYAISCDSCTDAIFLCCKYSEVQGSTITIPARTYISPPQSILQAGAKVEFEEKEWSGIYQLKPYPIYDAAKRLTSGMYIPGSHMCLSFHHKKPLKIGKGGMILTDDKKSTEAIRKLRYEGRTIGIPYHEDDLGDGGWNMYMTPEQAARGLTLLWSHPQHFDDIKEDPPYSDLRNCSLFNKRA